MPRLKYEFVCESNEAYLAKKKPGTFDLIVTSPPYNIGKSYESKVSLREYLDGQARVIGRCVALMASRGSICWQVGNHVDRGQVFPLDILLYPILMDFGLQLRNRIVWHFEHGLHCSKRLSGRHETILWLTKSDDYVFNLDAVRVPSKYPNKKHFKGPKKGLPSGNPLGKNPGDVWVIPNVKSNHVEKTTHPCQFPVELVERLVLALTEPGGTVLDPYAGVGSSLIAALKNDRRAFGCDISPEYVRIGHERISCLEQGTLRTRPMDRPVYDPAKPGGGQHADRQSVLSSERARVSPGAQARVARRD